MAFQLKDFTSAAASMMNFVKATSTKITDFNIGSVARTLLEAVAIEIEELYQNYFHGLKEAIPVSMYTTLDFNAFAAIPASNLIRVYVASSPTARTIPANTVFSSVGLASSYQLLADVTIPPSTTELDVRVVAVTPGVLGNIPAGNEFSTTPTISGFVRATNLVAFTNGMDAETPADRKARFSSYITSLARGTNAALLYGLKTASLVNAHGIEVERVKSATVVEPYLTDVTAPISLVNCYVHNGTGSTSGALVERAKQVVYGYYDENGVPVPGWKAAGVKVEVYPAIEALVDVAGTLTELPGYDKSVLITQAQQAIYAYLLALPIGEKAIKSEIVRLVKEVEGVYNIVFPALADEVAANAQTKLMPGSIALT